jgi:hypothetical protein
MSRISEYNWSHVISDASPLVEKQKDLELLTKENLIKMLEVK